MEWLIFGGETEDYAIRFASNSSNSSIASYIAENSRTGRAIMTESNRFYNDWSTDDYSIFDESRTFITDILAPTSNNPVIIALPRMNVRL